MRVAVSFLAFAAERDWLFVVITAIVLLILLFSIFFVGAVVAVGQHQQFHHSEYTRAFPVLIFSAAIAAGLLGALVGARLLAHLSNKILRNIFLAFIIVAAIEMVLHGFGIV